MRSCSLLTLGLLLAIGCTSCSARKDPGCGSLGPGQNPCSCDEIVVKAAKLPRPVHYASPEAIAEAAARREAMSAVRAAPAPAPPSPAPSTVPIGLPPPAPSSAASCGCSGANKRGPLETKELLSLNSNARIAPRFPPIGDLCFDIPNPSKESLTTVTRVTPAYPGKIRCNPPQPTDCMAVLNSLTGGRATQVLSGTVTLGDLVLPSQAAPPALAGMGQPQVIVTQASSAQISGSEFGPPTSCASDPDIVLEEKIIPLKPADPVSLSLAYMNRLPLQRKQIAAEDKLAFGHRMIPQESVSQKSTPNIPEEKLVTVDKPIMQLKKITAASAAAGADDEEDDVQLAELDAFERERLAPSSASQPPAASYVTYGELGYTPVERITSQPQMTVVSSMPASTAAEEESGCGPLGPAKSDYVPGNVYVDRDVVPDDPEADNGYEPEVIGDPDDEDEDDEGLPLTSLGTLARLNTVMGRYRAAARTRTPCPF